MNKRPRRPTGESKRSDSDKPNFSKKPTAGRSSGGKDFKKPERESSRGDSYKKGDGKKPYGKPGFDKKPYGKSAGSRGKFDKPTGSRDYSDKPKFDRPSGEKNDFSSADYRGKGGETRGKFNKPTANRDYSDKKSFDKPTRDKSDYSSSDSRGKFSKPTGKRDYTDKRDFDKPMGGKREYSRSDDKGKYGKPAGKRDFSDKKDFSKPPRGKSDYPGSDSRGKFSKPTSKKDYSDKKSFDKPHGKSDYSSGGYKGKSEKAPYPKKEYVAKPPRGYKKDWEETEKSIDVRLNRFISNSGICSRREADELIKAGKVTVNKIVVTEMGFKVTPKDVVRYEGKILKSEKLQYVLLNKPKGFITTMKDDRDRKTVMSLVEKACEERIYPVGRLDRNTTGLLLFTNDGDLAKRLTHPSYNIKKIYQVELDKPITQAHFDEILSGIQLEDGPIKADDLAILTPDNLTLGVEIHSGRNRIIRRIFEHLGYQVEKLDRVMFGNLTKKNLTRGDWRHLTPQEVSRL